MLTPKCFNIASQQQQRYKLLSQIINKRMTSYLKVHRKRFYRNVNVLPDTSGYLIQLDHKTIKTPLLNKLLACAIANEWHMQASEIDPNTMPLTTICNTA